MTAATVLSARSASAAAALALTGDSSLSPAACCDQFHSRRAHFDPARSGAEWWTQVVSARDAEVGTIGFHWDRDYDLQYDQGLCEHLGRSQALYGRPGPPKRLIGRGWLELEAA